MHRLDQIGNAQRGVEPQLRQARAGRTAAARGSAQVTVSVAVMASAPGE